MYAFLSAIAVMFGAYEQTSTPGLLGAIPVLAWELSLAGYLIIKGFRPASILTAPGQPATQPHNSRTMRAHMTADREGRAAATAATEVHAR